MMGQNRCCRGQEKAGQVILFFVLIWSFCSIGLAYNNERTSTNVPISINKCCPLGQSYKVETDECVTVNVVYNNNQSENVTNNQNSSFYGSLDVFSEPVLVIDQRLVLDLSDGNSSENRTELTFQLVPHLPADTCTDGSFAIQIDLREMGQNFQGDIPGAGNASVPSPGVTLLPPPSPIVFTSEGHLKLGNEYYSRSEYCVFGSKEEVLSIRVCNATCTGNSPCLRKCCDLNQVWNIARGRRQGCAPAGPTLWSPILYKYPKRKANPKDVENIQLHYKIIHPRVFCIPGATQPIAVEQRDDLGRYYWKFRINMDGTIFRRISRYTWKDKDDNPDAYCLDGIINSRFLPPDQDNQTEYSGIEQDEVLFECLPPIEIDPARPQSILYGVMMIFSCIFLFLTITVHILLWDKQPNHTWTLTLISYDASLFCFYVTLVTMHITQFYVHQGPINQINPLCYCIGVGVNFFLLSTFCWMSAVNFDIFRTFKSLKPTVGRTKGMRRYAAYSAFAWSVPITIVTVSVVMDYKYRSDFDSYIIVPEYGRTRCNMDAEYAQLVYSYGPAGLLLSFNLICFFITIYTMYTVQKSAKFATSSSSKSQKQKQSLKLFGKLLFVMGFPWIFEVISWYTEREKVNGNAWYFVIFDMINILQALAIFYTFVCKPDVIRMLEQKYPCFRRFLNRVMVSSETAEKLSTSHPKLKRFIQPITRRNKEMNSMTSRSGPSTEVSSISSNPGDSVRRGDSSVRKLSMAPSVVKMQKTPSIPEEEE